MRDRQHVTQKLALQSDGGGGGDSSRSSHRRS